MLQTTLCKGHFPLWDHELGCCGVELTLMTERDVMRPGKSCACTYDGDKLWLSIAVCIRPGAKSAKQQRAGLVNGWAEVRIRFRSPHKLWLMGHCQATFSLTVNEMLLKWLTPMPVVMQNHSGRDTAHTSLGTGVNSYYNWLTVSTPHKVLRHSLSSYVQRVLPPQT